jgi:hypothetical protein
MCAAMMTLLEKETLLCDAEFYELDELVALLGGCQPPQATADSAQSRSRNAAPIPSIASPLEAAWADLDRRRGEWTARAHAQERLRLKIEAVVSNEKIKLQLNQDEVWFASQQRTLVSGGGMLAAKFSDSQRWRADLCEDGSVFLDQDGSTFECILNLLRGYPMPKSLTEQQKRSLQHDLRYFGLDASQFGGSESVVEQGAGQSIVGLETWVLAPSPNATISEGGLVATGRGTSSWDCNVLGTVGWSQGVHEWTVVFRPPHTDRLLFIGVAPSTLELAGHTQFGTCGYWLYCHGGDLRIQGNSTQFTKALRHNDHPRISVRLDCNAHTLSFGFDGTWMPVAIPDLPAVTLFPAFCAHGSISFAVEPSSRICTSK